MGVKMNKAKQNSESKNEMKAKRQNKKATIKQSMFNTLAHVLWPLGGFSF